MRRLSIVLLLALACGDDDAPIDSGLPEDAGVAQDAGDADASEDAGPPPFDPDVLCPGR